MKILKNLLACCNDMIQSGGRSSAMKPMLYVVAFSFLGMWFSPKDVLFFNVSIKAVVGIVFCISLMAAIIGYFYLLMRDPRLLQSEKYQLSMRRMDIATQRLGKDPEFHLRDNSFEPKFSILKVIL